MSALRCGRNRGWGPLWWCSRARNHNGPCALRRPWRGLRLRVAPAAARGPRTPDPGTGN